MHKIYTTDYDYPDLEIEKNIYKNYPVEFIALKCTSEEELIDKAPDAEGLHNQYLKLSKKTFSSLKKLIVVARYGVGLDHINLEDAKKYNIIVRNVPDYCTEEVASHSLAMILAFLRKLKRSDLMVRKGRWDFSKLRPIHDFSYYSIGILGFGRIGRSLGKKLIDLGFKKLYIYDIDSSVVDRVDYKDYIKFAPDINSILKKSDFLILNLSLTKDSYHLLNKKTLKLLKKDVTIINTSRGSVINENDLYDFLKINPDANAGLDVLEVETPNINKTKFFELDNVIFSPHIAFYSEESLIKLKQNVTYNILEVLINNFKRS